MDEMRKLEEVISVIDALASGKGVRTAQRRALAECKEMVVRLKRKFENSEGARRKALRSEVIEVVAKVCELINAYFG